MAAKRARTRRSTGDARVRGDFKRMSGAGSAVGAAIARRTFENRAVSPETIKRPLTFCRGFCV